MGFGGLEAFRPDWRKDYIIGKITTKKLEAPIGLKIKVWASGLWGLGYILGSLLLAGRLQLSLAFFGRLRGHTYPNIGCGLGCHNSLP